MVLIGDTDYEFHEARKRGMHAIGIDIRKESVDTFRKSGGIAICDDFVVQMKNIKPDAIIFDGVSGMTKYTITLVAQACLYTTAVVWNGLRGRDKMAKEWQEDFADFEIDVYRKGRKVAKREAGIHRGMLMYSWAFYEELENLDTFCELSYPPEITSKAGEMLWRVHKYRDFVMNHNKPEFMSYRSKDSGQYFDTAAWTPIMPAGNYLPGSHGSARSRRKSAAAKALLTMQKSR